VSIFSLKNLSLILSDKKILYNISIDFWEKHIHSMDVNTEIYPKAFVEVGKESRIAVRDNGAVRAIPIVEVKHPRARVTHEAAIGSVETKQLGTLMASGLNEEEAVDVIVEGLLS